MRREAGYAHPEDRSMPESQCDVDRRAARPIAPWPQTRCYGDRAIDRSRCGHRHLGAQAHLPPRASQGGATISVHGEHNRQPLEAREERSGFDGIAAIAKRLTPARRANHRINHI